MTERLATLADVRNWLGILAANTDSDALIQRLILAASQFVFGYINRTQFSPAVYTSNFRGNGKTSVLLKNWPVLSVTSVGISGVDIPAATFNSTGYPNTPGFSLGDYREGPPSLDLYGYNFVYQAPCRIVYTAGYQAEQTITIPADPFQASTTESGQWVSDLGVTKAGVAMLKVSGTPNTGEYAVSDEGLYTFAAADAGQEVVISFGYAPYDIAQAVTELVGEFMKRKDRIGIASKGLAGGVSETVSFSQGDMNETCRSILQPYRSVVPV